MTYDNLDEWSEDSSGTLSGPAMDMGNRVSPNSTVDLPTFVSNNAGKTIDLEWQTFAISDNIDLPSDTVIERGYIEHASGGTFSESALISTPASSDREAFGLNRVILDGKGSVDCVRIRDSRRYWLRDCVTTDATNWHVELNGKHSNNFEGYGPTVTNHRVLGVSGNGSGGIHTTNGRDYVEIVTPMVRSTDRAGIRIDSENCSVIGGQVTFCGGTTDTAQILAALQADKTKVKGVTVNHSPQDGIRFRDVRWGQIANCQMLIHERHGIFGDGTKDTQVAGNIIGRANDNTDGTGDSIRIGTSSETPFPGNCSIHGNHVAVYKSTDNSVYGVDDNSISDPTSVKHNTDYGSQNGLETVTGDCVGNTPAVTFDSAPDFAENFRPIIATSSWDPDSDGNGEIVVTDDGGSTWQEIVNLPNT